MTFLRSLLFQILFYGVSAILVIFFSPFLLGPRRWVMIIINSWGKAVTFLLGAICGVKVEVRGREHIPAGGALIAAKHQTMFDVFGAYAILPDATFVMKKELTSIPIFGWWGIKSGVVVVDRGGHAKALKKMVRDSLDRMKEARQLIIFPEGTRQKPGATPAYKPGIAALYRELDMPVIPLAINSGAHWSAFTKTPGTIVFQFLPAIPPGLKRGEFMRELEGAIEPATQALMAE